LSQSKEDISASGASDALASGEPFVPSALIVSIPKSGTVFMNEMLKKTGLKNEIVSLRYFPEDRLMIEGLWELRKGKRVASAHIDAHPTNLQLLNKFVPRWIVHLRDPRSVTLSWTHHVDRRFREGLGERLYRVTPVPTPEYHSRDFEGRVWWQLENFLPCAVRWVEGWLLVAEAMQDRMKLTEFQQFRGREVHYVREILEFLQFDVSQSVIDLPEKNLNSHFRTGTVDEWQGVFSSDQLEYANRLIPDAWRKRFDWP
jgi:hypothetical protein